MITPMRGMAYLTHTAARLMRMAVRSARTVACSARTVKPTGRSQARAIPTAVTAASVVLAVAFALAFALALAPTAFAAEYSVKSVDIKAQVCADGTLDVTETRTFYFGDTGDSRFGGAFSRAYWTFPTKGIDGYEIEGVSQVDPASRELARTEDPAALDSRPEGMYLVEQKPGEVLVHAFHRSKNAEATLVLQYRVLGAAKCFADAGELYWQAIGPKWEVPASDVTITIDPPEELTKEQVRAWAHGPLTGDVKIADNGVVILSVDYLPAETFCEARVLYPVDSLAEAPVINHARESEVLAEEAKWAEEANQIRLRARERVERARKREALFTIILVASSVVVLILAIFVYIKHGRQHKAQFQGQYYREDPRPDLHPAVIGALWKSNVIEDSFIAATLMDLADKGVIHMTPLEVEKSGVKGLFGGKERTYALTRIPGTAGKETPLDKQLLDLLFNTVAAGQDSLILSQLSVYAKANPESFSEQVRVWKSAVSEEADRQGFFDASNTKWQSLVFALTGILGVVTVFAMLLVKSKASLIVVVPTLIALVVLGAKMGRLSAEGNELYQMYTAVRNFLKDFSRLHEAPPSSVVLWNRFLVLAVIFGIAAEVIKQLRVALPEVVSDPGFQTSYWWVSSNGFGSSPVSALSQSFTSASQVASSEMSDSSGGGGGFSGGGGGGFGGGGGGAD
ncbi:MAG: DUF2207 domain-containing protein [Coriobacteriia bacterium]|nr:DUF2207 domain-containing protein [Coriobacteriia bacterium]